VIVLKWVLRCRYPRRWTVIADDEHAGAGIAPGTEVPV
jgi:hypothetical protein